MSRTAHTSTRRTPSNSQSFKSNSPMHRRKWLGSADRMAGLYPFGVGVTMSLHKLTAGSGYDYLTRQVAALE
jgi:hypothetical protein